MPTPIENLVANVNSQTERDTLQSIGAQQSARRQVADKSSAINAICDNADGQACTNFFSGIAGDGVAEDLLTGDNALIDKVSERKEAIFGLNSSERAIRKCLCRREGRDPANFANLDAVVADDSLINDITDRPTSSNILVRSAKANTAADADDFAVRCVMCGTTTQDPTTFADADAISQDSTAMSEIAGDSTTMNRLAASQTAIQEVVSSQTARDEVFASQTAMQEVAASHTAMQEVAASQTVMQEVVNSQTALDEVLSTEEALDEIAASATARNVVTGSSAALNTIEAASTSQSNSVPITNSASVYVAELSGAGGGGGDFQKGGGGDGQPTTFHETLAEGGQGGPQGSKGTAGPGGASVASPDFLINKQVGGGSSGGSRNGRAKNGGPGGFVKALIFNPERDPLTLSLGNGGNGPGVFANDGEDGTATIFTPNDFQ